MGTLAQGFRDYSVAHFEKVVVEANAELLGCNSGWSRYLDWHLGVACDSPQSLDKIGPKLCVDGSGFHGHVSSANKKVSSEGSLCAGAGADSTRQYDDGNQPSLPPSLPAHQPPTSRSSTTSMRAPAEKER